MRSGRKLGRLGESVLLCWEIPPGCQSGYEKERLDVWDKHVNPRYNEWGWSMSPHQCKSGGFVARTHAYNAAKK